MHNRLSLAALAVPLLLLQLHGCGVAPTRDADQSYRYKSARTPYSAAICIARNARSSASGVHAEERTLDASAWEVVVRSRATILAVAEVRDDGVGSAVSIMVDPGVTSGREEFARRLMSGC